MSITDNKFIGQEPPKNDGDKSFVGIGNSKNWTIDKVAQIIGTRQAPPDDDPMPVGTRVEFCMPNSDEFRHGIIASKCGEEYIVEISDGESCLVPPGSLSKIVEADRIAEVLKHEFMPNLELKFETTEDKKHIATVEYKERYPSDNQIIKWSSVHFPELKLVDAIHKKARNIDLIFEIQAAEDVRPQGGDSFTRAPGLMSQEIDGTGVIGEVESLSGVSESDVEEGAEHELEHTDNEEVAREIAIDHLAEDPDYYHKMDKHHSKEFELKDMIIPKIIKLSDVVSKPINKEAANFDIFTDSVNEASKQHDMEIINSNNDQLSVRTTDESLIQSFNDMAEGYGIEPAVNIGGIFTWENPLAGFEMTSQKEVDKSLRYQELHKAAEWVLGRFNDSNPEYYAAPTQIGMTGHSGEHIFQLFFSLKKKGENKELDNLYFDNRGKMVTAEEASSGMDPVTGYVQVDSDANLPVVMLSTPTGMESAQKYGFNFTASNDDYYSEEELETITAARRMVADVCASVADAVLAEFGCYSAEAQADFDARLTKLAVDPKAKEYWSSYFKEYGNMLTRDVPRKKDKKKAESDYSAYIKKVDGGYEVKSKKNPKWSGGTYKSKSKAEERLGEVEMFKHMKGSAESFDETYVDLFDIEKVAFWGRRPWRRPVRQRPTKRRTSYPTTGPDLRSIENVGAWAIEQATQEEDWELYDLIRWIGHDYMRKNPDKVKSTNMNEALGEAFRYALQDDNKHFNTVMKYLKNWDKRRTKWQTKQLQKERKELQNQRILGKEPQSQSKKEKGLLEKAKGLFGGGKEEKPQYREGPVEMGEGQPIPTKEQIEEYRRKQQGPPPPSQEMVDESMSIQQQQPPFSPVARTAGIMDMDDEEFAELISGMTPEQKQQLLEDIKREEAEAISSTIPEEAKLSKDPSTGFTSWEIEPERPESPLTTPTKQEEYERATEYHPPGIEKGQTEAINNMLESLEKSVISRYPVEKGDSILTIELPVISPGELRPQDVDYANTWAGLKLWEALWLVRDDSTEYAQLQNVLARYHPEIYATYLYQTKGKENAKDIHDELNDAHGRKIKPIDGYYLPDSKPKPGDKKFICPSCGSTAGTTRTSKGDVRCVECKEQIKQVPSTQFTEKTPQVDPGIVEHYLKKVKRETSVDQKKTQKWLEQLEDYVNANFKGGMDAVFENVDISREQYDGLPLRKRVDFLRDVAAILIKEEGRAQPKYKEVKKEEKLGPAEFIQKHYPRVKEPAIPRREEELPELDEVEYLIHVLNEQTGNLSDRPPRFQAFLKQRGITEEKFRSLDQDEQVRLLQGELLKFMEEIPKYEIEKHKPRYLEEGLPSRMFYSRGNKKIAAEPEFEVIEEDEVELSPEDVEVEVPEGMSNEEIEDERIREKLKSLPISEQIDQALPQEQYGNMDPREWKNRATEFDIDLARKLLDPESKERKAYEYFLNWSPVTSAGLKSKGMPDSHLYKSFRDTPIKVILVEEWGPGFLTSLARESDPGLAKLIMFAMKAHGTVLPELSKQKQRKERRKLRQPHIPKTPEEIWQSEKFLREPVSEPAFAPGKKKRKPLEPTGRPYEGPTIHRKQREEEPSEAPTGEIDSFWFYKIPGGPHKGKELWEALQDASEEEKLDLQNMLRLKAQGVWLSFVEHTQGPVAADREAMLLDELQSMADETEVEDLLSEDLKYQEYMRGKEIVNRIDADEQPLTVQDAVELGLHYKDKEPGVLKYIIWHLKNSKGEEAQRKYEEAQAYLHSKKPEIAKELEEYRKEKLKKKHPSEVKLQMGSIEDPWFNKTIEEAANEVKSLEPEQQDKFVNYIRRHYPIEWKEYRNWQKSQKEKPPQRREDIPTEIEKKDREKIEKERELLRMNLEKEKKDKEKKEVPVPGKQPVTTFEPKRQRTKEEIQLEKLQKRKKQLQLEELNRRKEQLQNEKLQKRKEQLLKEMKKNLTKIEGAVMRREGDAGPGPYAYNASGKDDKKDYDYKERNKQPARSHNKFCINRMFSTTSSDDNGYVMMDIGWDPELFENMSPQNVQHQIISFIKGLESDKYFHDFGIMGKPKIIEFDEDAGVAQVKVRCSESRGIMTLTYGGELKDDVLPLKGIR